MLISISDLFYFDRVDVKYKVKSSTTGTRLKKKITWTYCKTSSRGAFMDMILFEVFFKNIHLIPQDQIV